MRANVVLHVVWDLHGLNYSELPTADTSMKKQKVTLTITTCNIHNATCESVPTKLLIPNKQTTLCVEDICGKCKQLMNDI